MVGQTRVVEMGLNPEVNQGGAGRAGSQGRASRAGLELFSLVKMFENSCSLRTPALIDSLHYFNKLCFLHAK